eukprot:COSAG01_NODE_30032_length_624_cov_1.702857_1_plen_66_part_10
MGRAPPKSRTLKTLCGRGIIGKAGKRNATRAAAVKCIVAVGLRCIATAANTPAAAPRRGHTARATR